MKKYFVLIIIFIVSIFCFGCGKEEKPITINIYNGSTTDEVKSSETTTDDKRVDNFTSNSKQSLGFIDKIKEKFNMIKDWYNENKDELKETSKKVIQSDIDKLKETKESIKDWYDEKARDKVEKFTDSIQESLSDDFGKLKDFFDDLKN